MGERAVFVGVWTAALAGALLCSAGARAGSFALREQSPEAEGESFAGVAAGVGGLSSMFWNPATITQSPGVQSSWGLTGALPYAKITPKPPTPTLALGNSGNIIQSALIPSSTSSYQINNWLWLGLQTDSPYGLITKSNYVWAADVYGRTSKVLTYGFTPTIGVKVNDWLSLGAGVEALYFKTRLTSAIFPGSAPTATLAGNSWGVGFTLGATITPRAGTTLGIGFRSQIKEDVAGFLTLPPAPGFGIKTNLTLPATVTAGLSQVMTDRLTLNAGYEFTNWSVFNSFPVISTAALPFPPAGTTVTTLAFKYRDGHFFSLGGDYKWDDRITLRAGAGYEISPIDDANRGVRLPDSDRVWASIGGSYQLTTKLKLNVSYAHLFPLGKKVDITPTNPAFAGVGLPFFGTLNSHIDIVAASLDYRWDAGAPAPAPLVRKF